MNKLVVIASLLVSPAVFACPGMDHADDNTPKTAQKTPGPAKEQPKAPAKEQPKQEAPKPDTAKAPAKEQPKKPGDKVSIK
jgi:hypothetical protein